jgi:MFS family permease
MRNVKLLYIITALRYTWFWLGTWAIYYSSFGGYYVIGLLETVMIVTCILAEIPTGALADLLGKKKTLILSFFLSAVANVWMGFAPDILNMALSLVLLNIGGTFASGAFEALVYDSLKEEKKTSKFNRVLANISTVRMLALGISSIVGGYVALIDMRFPYHMNGIGQFLAMIFALFLIEPHFDSVKLTVKGYLKQNLDGLNHLFRTKRIRKLVVSLLIVSSLVIILREGLDDILLLDFGFNNKVVELGYISAAYSFIAAFATFIVPRITTKWNQDKLYIVYLVMTATTLFFSPFITLYVGLSTILFRIMAMPLIENHISTKLNDSLESQFRATSLSAFSMIQSIPYALVIFGITYLTDIVPSSYIAFAIGCIILMMVIILRSKLIKKNI